MKAIGFFREPASSKGASLASQNRSFLEFCEHHGYDVAVTFVETAESNGRSGFRQLVDYLRKPDRGFVVVVTTAGREHGGADRNGNPEEAEASKRLSPGQDAVGVVLDELTGEVLTHRHVVLLGDRLASRNRARLESCEDSR